MWPAVPRVSGAGRSTAASESSAPAQPRPRAPSPRRSACEGRAARRPSWIATDQRAGRRGAERSPVPPDRARRDRHSRALQLEQRQRPAAHPANRERCHAERRSAIRPGAARPVARARRSDASSIASTGISRRARCGVAVQQQRRLERRERQLVDPQRPGQRMASGRRRPPRAVPTSSPACGPPSSLSPEQHTSAAPADERTADRGLLRRAPACARRRPAPPSRRRRSRAHRARRAPRSRRPRRSRPSRKLDGWTRRIAPTVAAGAGQRALVVAEPRPVRRPDLDHRRARTGRSPRGSGSRRRSRPAARARRRSLARARPARRPPAAPPRRRC